MTNILWTLIICGVAGWLAGKLTTGKGFGVLADIVIGIVGGLIGSFLFGLIGWTAYGLIGTLIVSTIGAMLLVWVARKLAK